MKKQKVIIFSTEQQNKSDLDAIHSIQEGLNLVDQFPVYTPDLSWFEQMVLAKKQQDRKNLIRDLLVFLLVAVLIISGIIVSLYNMPMVFIYLQIITTIFIAFYTTVRFVKKVNNG
ncbi:MAG TPA: YxlC family protein [Neobacillus sp.]|jgi:heme A synthase